MERHYDEDFSGYNQGYEDGYEEGSEEGFEDAHEEAKEAFDRGHEEGYKDGLEDGYKAGREEGREDAQEETKDTFERGFEKGLEDGHEQGLDYLYNQLNKVTFHDVCEEINHITYREYEYNIVKIIGRLCSEISSEYHEELRCKAWKFSVETPSKMTHLNPIRDTVFHIRCISYGNTRNISSLNCGDLVLIEGCISIDTLGLHVKGSIVVNVKRIVVLERQPKISPNNDCPTEDSPNNDCPAYDDDTPF